MATFKYTAMNTVGRECSGKIENVETQADAINQIKQDGLFPTNISEIPVMDEKETTEIPAGEETLFDDTEIEEDEDEEIGEIDMLAQIMQLSSSVGQAQAEYYKDMKRAADALERIASAAEKMVNM